MSERRSIQTLAQRAAENITKQRVLHMHGTGTLQGGCLSTPSLSRERSNLCLSPTIIALAKRRAQELAHRQAESRPAPVQPVSECMNVLHNRSVEDDSARLGERTSLDEALPVVRSSESSEATAAHERGPSVTGSDFVESFDVVVPNVPPIPDIVERIQPFQQHVEEVDASVSSSPREMALKLHARYLARVSTRSIVQQYHAVARGQATAPSVTDSLPSHARQRDYGRNTQSHTGLPGSLPDQSTRSRRLYPKPWIAASTAPASPLPGSIDVTAQPPVSHGGWTPRRDSNRSNARSVADHPGAAPFLLRAALSRRLRQARLLAQQSRTYVPGSGAVGTSPGVLVSESDACIHQAVKQAEILRGKWRVAVSVGVSPDFDASDLTNDGRVERDSGMHDGWNKSTSTAGLLQPVARKWVLSEPPTSGGANSVLSSCAGAEGRDCLTSALQVPAFVRDAGMPGVLAKELRLLVASKLSTPTSLPSSPHC